MPGFVHRVLHLARACVPPAPSRWLRRSGSAPASYNVGATPGIPFTFWTSRATASRA
jgi:hypothetical protein